MTTALVVATAALMAAVFWWGMRTGRRAATPTAESDTRAELARRLAELFALQELTYVLSDSVDLERIAEQVVRYVTRFAHADGVLVALRPEAATALWVIDAGGVLDAHEGARYASVDGTLVGRALATSTLQVAGDGPQVPLIGETTTAAAAAVPLQSHGTAVGAIAIARSTATPFTPDELRLLTTVATHAALALANARFVRLTRRAKEEWEATFDALSDGIAVVDGSGAIRRANRALAALIDREPRDAVGTHLVPALRLEPERLIQLLDVARAGAPLPPTTLSSNEPNRFLRITAAPLRGEGPGWVVVLIEDVTEQRALEETVRQNEKMAAVGQLVSGVAHELNNPLTSIVGLSEFLLQGDTVAPATREHLQVVHQQAERAAEIVRHLLTFARKEPAERGDEDLHEIIDRTVALIAYEIRLREIDLQLALGRHLPPVHGDPHQLQQVVLNLLNNAVHAVSANPPERPRTIVVTTDAFLGGIRLRVADSGPGISSDVLPRIFDPFFTTKEPGKGTGLGLAITYGIVQGHGGTIRAERPTGGGVAFTVWLPRSEGAAAATAGDGTRRTVAPLIGEGRRVLLLDGDAAVRRMVELVLSHDGYVVEAARDGTHAARLLEERSFGLILADPGTPLAPGRRFADHLCELHPDLRSRTIFLTGDVRSETEEWLRGTGCRYYRKPFHARDLLQAVHEIAAQ